MKIFRPQSLAVVLFAVSLFLLITYLVLEKIYTAPVENKPSVSSVAADSVFRSVLSDFGIKESWLSRQKNNYTVRLPLDVPAELIQLDIINQFPGKDFVLRSREIKKNKRSDMEVYSGGDLLYSAEFIYDKACLRETKEVSFILMNFDDLSDDEAAKLLNSTEYFAVALIPSRENRWLGDSLVKLGKNYVLLLDDNISELEYQIDDKFSDRKLMTTFLTIADNFKQAVFFLLDDIASQYSVRVNNFLLNELKKRKIRFYLLHDLPLIDRNYPPKDLQAIYNHAGIILMDASEFMQKEDEFKSMRKKGIRLVNISAFN